ncbi:MAG: hypothetical protein R2774_14350 [Saprospiraceae bacterium]
MSKFKPYFYIFIGIFAFWLILTLMISPQFETKLDHKFQVQKPFVYNILNDLNLKRRISYLKEDESFKLTCKKVPKGQNAQCSYKSEKFGDGNFDIPKSNNDTILILQNPEKGYATEIQYIFVKSDSLSTDIEATIQGRTSKLSSLFKWFKSRTLKSQLEKELANVKEITDERSGLKLYNGFYIKEQAPNTRYFLYNSGSVKGEEIQQFYTQTLATLYQNVINSGVAPSGPACKLYFSWFNDTNLTEVGAAVPTIAENNIAAAKTLTIPSRRSVIVEYVGDQRGLGFVHTAIDDYLADHNLAIVPPVIEEYVSDPSTNPALSTWKTNIIYYVKPK